MKLRTRWFVVGGALLACSVYVALWGSLGAWFPTGDYPEGPCNGCDSAGPPLAFLVHGHISQFFSAQPFMGSVSLLLRAPAVAIVTLFKGDITYQYRVGALVLFLIVAVLLLPAFNLMLRRGQRLWIVLALIACVFVGPATLGALRWGHPEELLGGALAVAAVLAASHRRPVGAGVLLGLAVATKQWGVFAVLPVLMLSHGKRRLVASTALIVAAVFIIPMIAGDPSTFFAQNFNTANAQLGVTKTNIWWPFHHLGFDPTSKQQLELIPDSLRVISHPLAVVLSVGASVLYWRRSAGRHPYDALQLLALLFLIRCLVDPLTISYHHVPFLIAIATFEGLSRRGIPIITLTSTAAILLIANIIAPLNKPDLMNEIYLLWGLSTTAWLAWGTFTKRASTPASLRVIDQPPLARPLTAQ